MIKWIMVAMFACAVAQAQETWEQVLVARKDTIVSAIKACERHCGDEERAALRKALTQYAAFLDSCSDAFGKPTNDYQRQREAELKSEHAWAEQQIKRFK